MSPRWICLTPVLFVSVPTLCSANLTEHQFQHAGLLRRYLLHVPESSKTARSPLLLILHGGKGTADKAAKMIPVKALGAKEKPIVAYPEAHESHWNDGRGFQRYPSHRKKIDDVGFLSSLIDKLINEHNADPARV